MVPTKFSTMDVAPAERADAWHRWFWPIFDVTPKASRDGRYLAKNEVWNVGGLVVSQVVGPPAIVRRNKANLAKAPIDHWVLGCCRRGVTSIQTERAFLKAGPNEPFLWSLGEASGSTRTQVDRVQVLLPRDMFPEIRTQLDALRGVVLGPPSSVVLSEYLNALTRWLPETPVEAMPRMAASVHNMISACLVPNADNIEKAEPDMNVFHLDRVRRAVQMHLRSPSLGPAALCRMVGISRSSLYRLFASDGGIMRYVQRQRLLHARAILSDPLDRQTVQAISEDLCFSDASSFSRAFRREFGWSPSEMRASAVGRNPPPRSPPREPGGAGSYADFLRAEPLRQFAPYAIGQGGAWPSELEH